MSDEATRFEAQMHFILALGGKIDDALNHVVDEPMHFALLIWPERDNTVTALVSNCSTDAQAIATLRGACDAREASKEKLQ